MPVISIGRRTMLLAAFVVTLSLPFSAGAADLTITERCLKEMNEKGLTFGEERACEARMQQQQAEQVKESACSANICTYRLRYIAPGTYTGRGYTLKPDISYQSGVYRSILTNDKGGQETVLERSCGAGGGCPMGNQVVSGPLKGATFTGPYDTGEQSFAILTMPVSRKVELASKHTAPVGPWKYPTERTPLRETPATLRGRTVHLTYPAQRVAHSGYPPEDFTAQWKWRFQNAADILEFASADSGYIFQLNTEVDFYGQPERAPKSHQKETFYKFQSDNGLITIQNGLFRRTRTRETVISGEFTGKGGAGNTKPPDDRLVMVQNHELQFSDDYTRCALTSAVVTQRGKPFVVLRDGRKDCQIR